MKVRTLLFAVFALLLAACDRASVSSPETPAPRVVIVEVETVLGRIALALYPDQAPITVANFLRYLDAGHFDAGSFYRTVRLDNQAPADVPIEVVQGGMGLWLEPGEEPPAPFPPIAHESTAQTGLRHRDGALSMARGAPGSASSEFFIALGDNPALDFGGDRNPDGQGFAVFGQVIEGREVLDTIHRQRSDRALPAELKAVQGQILNEPIRFRLRRR
jgi:peptidyl-prolyl cis-trans isomerase A (cyclophilin A)